MSRSWFKCAECGIECDNSAVAPGYEDKPLKICRVCEKSYCGVCDSLYGQPEPTAIQGWTAQCPECGNRDFFTPDIARNIIHLNHRLRKKETAHDPR